MLNNTEIEAYKKQLEERRTKLMEEIAADSTPNNPGNDVTSDGEDEADEAEAFSNQLALAQTLIEEVQEIDESLERIRKGTFGICIKCGMEISKEVLGIAPESALCEKCKLEI